MAAARIACYPESMRRASVALLMLLVTAWARPMASSRHRDLRDRRQAQSAFTTDSTAYTATADSGASGRPKYHVRIITRYSNTTSAPLYLKRCLPQSTQPMYGVALVEQPESWGAAYTKFWECVPHDRLILVAPGEVRIDTLELRGPNASDGGTGMSLGATSGRFVISFSPLSCPGPDADARCEVKASKYRISNEFTIRVP